MHVHMLFRNLIETIFEKANIGRKYIGIWSRFIGIDRWHRAQTGYRMYVYSKTVTVQFRRLSCPSMIHAHTSIFTVALFHSYAWLHPAKYQHVNFILFRIC